MEVRTEGFLLSLIRYQENDEIATFFTPLGLYPVIRKDLRKKGKDPLTLYGLYDLLLVEKREGLSRLLEAHLIHPHLFLRDKIEYIEAAGEMAEALSKFLLPQEPAELLYALFIRFIRRIPRSVNLTSLIAIFYYKLLSHEGILPPSFIPEQTFSTFTEIENFPVTLEQKEWMRKNLRTGL